MRLRTAKCAITLFLALAYAAPTGNVLKILDMGNPATQREKKRKGVVVVSTNIQSVVNERVKEVVLIPQPAQTGNHFKYCFIYRDASRSIFTPPPRA